MKNALGGIVIFLNILLLLWCLRFGIGYAFVYENQVHQMKILYSADDQDILSREAEIKNIFLLLVLVGVGIIGNTISTIVLMRRNRPPGPRERSARAQ